MQISIAYDILQRSVFTLIIDIPNVVEQRCWSCMVAAEKVSLMGAAGHGWQD